MEKERGVSARYVGQGDLSPFVFQNDSCSMGRTLLSRKYGGQEGGMGAAPGGRLPKARLGGTAQVSHR